MVQFDNLEDLDFVLNEGPWFWGRMGLFITPWFLAFDAKTMVVTNMPVWERLNNLPFPLSHHQVLEGIGNTLGKFLKMDQEKMEKYTFNFAGICVEIDLIKGVSYGS